jgi:hypothetical protein
MRLIPFSRSSSHDDPGEPIHVADNANSNYTGGFVDITPQEPQRGQHSSESPVASQCVILPVISLILLINVTGPIRQLMDHQGMIPGLHQYLPVLVVLVLLQEWTIQSPAPSMPIHCGL